MPTVPGTPNFRTNQIMTSIIVASGASGNSSRIMIADSSSMSSNTGAVNSLSFSTTSIGSDTFIYISGSIATTGKTPGPNGPGVAVFGGDIMVSGNVQFLTGVNFGSSVTGLPSNSLFVVSGGIGSALTRSIAGLANFTGDVMVTGTLLVSSGIIGTPRSLLSPWISGTWYFANVVSPNFSAPDTSTFSGNTLHLVPHVFEDRTLISEMAVGVTSGAVNTGVRFGFYNASSSNDIRPNQLLFDNGSTVSTAISSVVSCSCNLVLTPGLYWFAINVSASAGQIPTLRAPAMSCVSPILGLNPAAIFTGISYYSSASNFGPYPTSLGTLSSQNTRIPGIAFKRTPVNS